MVQCGMALACGLLFCMAASAQQNGGASKLNYPVAPSSNQVMTTTASRWPTLIGPWKTPTARPAASGLRPKTS